MDERLILVGFLSGFAFGLLLAFFFGAGVVAERETAPNRTKTLRGRSSCYGCSFYHPAQVDYEFWVCRHPSGYQAIEAKFHGLAATLRTMDVRYGGRPIETERLRMAHERPNWCPKLPTAQPERSAA